MKLSEIKHQLKALEQLNFALEDGTLIPKHFHVTEVGRIQKDFIDCGGTRRQENVINFQLWSSTDYDHRLAPQKLMNIIELSEKELGLEDAEVEVEYQSDTIGKYGLDFNGQHFVLTSRKTACLAQENCGIPVVKKKINLAELQVAQGGSCSPGSGCC